MAVVFEPSLIKSQPTVTTFFSSALAQGKLSHAYLFAGGNTDDKWHTIRQIALYLNCEVPSKETSGSCGIRQMDNEKRCQSCRWILEGKHPQAWFELKDREAATIVIPVERARQVAAELAKTSSYKRVIIVEDASQDVFHRPAANALLKTIEEPRGVILFAFFARSVEQVLATIVSRCQVIPFIQDGRELVGPITLSWQGTEVLPRLMSQHKDLVPLVQAMRTRKFFDWSKARSDKTSHRRIATHDSVTESEKALSVTDALEFGKMMIDLIDNEHDMDAIIDGAVLTEIEIIGTRALCEPQVSNYLRSLALLADETKRQLRRYVTKKAAVDSFVIDWANLRNATAA